MSKRDYYEVLGIQRTATDVEIKASFRKLAMKHHPDRNPGDTECEHKFKEVAEAHEILKDPDKRAAYDRYGHAAFEQGGGGAGGFDGGFANTFADIFDDFFGMGGRFTGRRRSTEAFQSTRARLDRLFRRDPGEFRHLSLAEVGQLKKAIQRRGRPAALGVSASRR